MLVGSHSFRNWLDQGYLFFETVTFLDSPMCDEFNSYKLI